MEYWTWFLRRLQTFDKSNTDNEHHDAEKRINQDWKRVFLYHRPQTTSSRTTDFRAFNANLQLTHKIDWFHDLQEMQWTKQCYSATNNAKLREEKDHKRNRQIRGIFARVRRNILRITSLQSKWSFVTGITVWWTLLYDSQAKQSLFSSGWFRNESIC